MGGEGLGSVAGESLVSACLFGPCVSGAVLAEQNRNRWGNIVGGGALLFGAQEQGGGFLVEVAHIEQLMI